jgi:hypothetical protein
MEKNAVALVIADHAVLDVQRSAGIELGSTITDTGSLDDQAAQVDFVVWSGVDRDAGAVGRHRDARLAETADDADRLVDGDRAVLGSSVLTSPPALVWVMANAKV